MEYSWDIKGCTPPAIKRGNWTVSRENYPTKWCIFRQTGSRRSSHALKWKWTQLIQLIIFFKPRSSQIQNPIPPFLFNTNLFSTPEKNWSQSVRWFLPNPFFGPRYHSERDQWGGHTMATCRGVGDHLGWQKMGVFEAGKRWTKTHGEQGFWFSWIYYDSTRFNQIEL